MRKLYGFTIIELVIVILAVSILAAYAVYNWPSTVINIDAQAKQFADDIRLTQSLSMAQTTRYRIVKTSATTYQILDGAGSAITLPSGDTTETLSSDLSFGTWTNLTNNLIAFDGKGTPYLDATTPGTALSAGTTYSITIIGSGNMKTITITPITGMVSIQ